MMLLGGCATPNFKVICPPLATYTKEFQSKVADALENKSEIEIQQIVGDYLKLRDACRSLKD
jgi:hypothetical protein